MNFDLSFYKGKKVFVTGHTGFKGSWLCKILANAGAIVTGYSLNPPTTPSLFEIANIEQDIHSVIGDIRDYKTLKAAFDEAQPEIVLHLAAQPIVRDSYKDPAYTYETNVMGAGILDGFQTIIPTAAAVLSEKRQILRLTQQEVADRAKITLRQYQRLESGERNILTSSFGLACRVIEALDMDVSKFYHGAYYLEEEVKTMRGKGIASRKKSSI